MKTLKLSIATIILFTAFHTKANVGKDTIAINFGEHSKIIIYVRDKSDLQALQQYDINQMLRDLQLSIDTAKNDVRRLTIADSSGTLYLKDTLIVRENDLQPFPLEGYQKEIPVARFTGINIGSNFRVFVKKSDSYRLILAGDERDVEDVKVFVKTDQLHVERQLRDSKKVDVYLEMPALDKAEFSGAARARIAGFESDRFEAYVSGAAHVETLIVAAETEANVSGAGYLRLIGKSARFHADVSGAAKLDASGFETAEANIDADGAAKVWLNRNQSSNISTSGAARIYKVNGGNRESLDDGLPEKVNVRIGKYEFRAEVDDWEETGRRLEEFDSFKELERRIETTEEIQKSPQRVRHSFNLEFGLNNYLENDEFPDAAAPYNVKPWGSWYVAVNSYHKFHLAGPLFIDWGKGLNWYNFKFENPDIRIVSEADGLSFEEDPRDFHAIKSKLTASYLSMSLVPMLDFSKGLRRVKSYSLEGLSFTKYDKRGFRIGAGPYIGYRLGAHSKFVYSENGRKRDKESGSFYLNNWRYGVRAQLGYKALDLFFNYDVSELFAGGDAPSLRPVSFGIIF